MSKSIRIDADELLSCFETLKKRAWREDDAYEATFSRGYWAAMKDVTSLVEYRKSVEERVMKQEEKDDISHIRNES